MNFPILTSLIALPIVGALLLLAVPDDERNAPLIRGVALIVSLLVFAETLLLWNRFSPTGADFQFPERHAWIPAFGINYIVGVDGISVLLLVLTGFLTPIALLGSWDSIHKRLKAFCIFMLLLESAMMGVFVAMDLFLFYVFWDAMLVPMYFLIGIWGYDRRIYAAVKFILYTMAGSVLMLLAILGLAYLHSTTNGSYSFELARLSALEVPPHLQFWFFLAFALAFAIKVPLFPFHTWLPDAHVEAPTAGSIILAGILLKMGTYGFLRFCLPLFPDASLRFGPWVFALAVVGVVYGAWVSTVQPDLKKLVAYSSVSHLGFVMLGIFSLTAQGLVGAIIQMINHGLSTGALFLMVGIIYERRHTRLISEFGGLWQAVPAFSALFLVVVLSSLGLPGLNGFVGEFLILVGVFQVSPPLAALSTTGIIFAAVYLLWMYQRVIFGPLTREENRRLPDLDVREWSVVLPLVIFIVWIGVYPVAFTGTTETAVEALIAQVQSKASVALNRP